MTQYNPNPNGTASTSGWSASSGVTLTATADGLRIQKGSGSGKYVYTPAMTIGSTAKVPWLCGMRIRRNSASSYGIKSWTGQVQYSTGGWTDGWGEHGAVSTTGSAGVWVAIPNHTYGWEQDGTIRLRFALADGAVDLTVKGVNVYDATSAPANTVVRDSSDLGASVVPNGDNSLTAKATHDGRNDEAVSSLRWEWGDGSSTAQSYASTDLRFPATTHTYAAAGTYTVTVRTPSSSPYEASRTYTVKVPTGTFEARFDYETEFLRVDVDASASVAPSLAPIDTYAWEWGDGTTTAASASKYASHTYALPGKYNVTLTIKTNSVNRTATQTQEVTATSAPAPGNYIAASKDRLTVTFAPSIQDGSSYAWSFGDGETNTDKNPVHTYATPGTYTVTLLVNGSSSATLVVTVSDVFTPIRRIRDALKLEVAQPSPTGYYSPRNLLKNISGELGAWGWRTPAAGATLKGSTTFDQADDHGIVGPKLIYRSSGSGEQTVETARVRVTRGTKTYANVVAFQLVCPFIEGSYRMQVVQLDAAGNVTNTGSAFVTPYQTASDTPTNTGQRVEDNTAYAYGKITFYANSSGGIPAAGKVMQFRSAILASQYSMGSPFTTPEGLSWTDLLGSTSDIDIDRDALNVGTLSANIPDSNYDPAVSGTIRPGQPVRVRVKSQDETGNTVWEPIYTGTVTRADVEYRQVKGATPGPKATRIKLSATDAVTVLSQTTEPRGVSDISELPELLEGVEVPYDFNGITGSVVAPDVVSWNPNASLLDQVAITRDTEAGYAYVNRRGVLIGRSPAYMPTVPVGLVDERAYSGVQAGFSTAECINSVTIKWLRYSGGAEPSVEEITYGPYEDPGSIDEWGFHPATFTMQGVENPSTIQAKAEAVLAANGTPRRLISVASVPIRHQEDLVPSRALLDLYDLVRLGYQRTETDDLIRVTSVKHTIKATKDGGTWLVTLGFSADGAVAAPQLVASPPATVSAGGLPFGSRFSTASQTIANNTWRGMTLDGAEALSGGVTWNATTREFTVPRDGVYMLNAGCNWTANANGVRFIRVMRNCNGAIDNATGETLITIQREGATVDAGIYLTRPIALNAGDRIRYDHRQSSGGNLDAYSSAGKYTFASITFLGA